jgi:hypothetical protein
VLDLEAPFDLGRHVPDGAARGAEGLGVVGGEPGVAAVDSALELLARTHGEDVGPETADLLLDRAPRPLAEGAHRDHGRDADHDPERGEERPELVGVDRLERDAEHFGGDHPRLSARRRPAPGRRPAR